ncbi:MAG: hypothetical protein LBJ44_09740 [Propionibacteriaceae bacterium]|nr:hypothetical protein [Propionibacteriaceae bacterium]
MVGLAGLIILVATLVECRLSRPWLLGLALGLTLGTAVTFGLVWLNSFYPPGVYAEGVVTLAPGR